jgi:hypothetical protein
LTTPLRSQFRAAAAFLSLFVVIEVGHVARLTQEPYGFVRIARDLGRKSCQTKYDSAMLQRVRRE